MKIGKLISYLVQKTLGGSFRKFFWFSVPVVSCDLQSFKRQILRIFSCVSSTFVIVAITTGFPCQLFARIRRIEVEEKHAPNIKIFPLL